MKHHSSSSHYSSSHPQGAPVPPKTLPKPQNRIAEPNYTVVSSTLPLPQGCGEEFPSNDGWFGYTKVRARTPFPYHVADLSFTNRKPDNDYTFLNPSIIAAPDNDKFYVALREASYHFCPGHGNYRSSYESRIVFGVADNPRGPAKYCSTFTDHSGRTMFNGPEDPRFMYIAPPGSNGKKILHISHVLDGTMHLSRVNYTLSGNSCTAQETNRLQMWVSGTNRNMLQKNWMFIPDSTTSDGKPLFAYKLNPLEVLGIDMTTGEGKVVSSQPQLSCVPKLRGTTMFLHHPSKPNVFIGIAHETLTSQRYFASRVITIEEYKPYHFKLTGMSDRFGIPSRNDDICVDRIHFPSSMMYGDENNKTIIISMGYMDCTIHTVQVPTSHFLSSVKPLSC